jgi:SAM-dependent methyltransferase
VDFDDITVRQMRANQENWDARTPMHVASRFYGLDGSRSPDSWFGSFEWDDLGPLNNRDVVHLQCHLGTETVAFAQRGARTTGLDISGESIAQARLIAQRAGVDVDYVQANVYDAADILGKHRFDVIYTGKGAICYLPDLPRWASVVADLLRPGGLLYIVEFHPMLQSLSPKPAPGDDPGLLLRHDYLEGRGALERASDSTYTDGPALENTSHAYEWAHGLGDVITALVNSGLTIARLRESELLPWPRWDRMVQDDSGWWRLPPSDPRIPLLYGLRATKP